MANLVTPAIVLRRADYRDNDRVLTLLSPVYGRMEALSRGCRKMNSPLAGASEAFCCGEYVFFKGKEKASLTGCEITESFFPLRENMDRLTFGVYFLNLCEACAQPGEDSRALYVLLLRTLNYLTYGDNIDLKALCTAFLTDYVRLLGFKPRLLHCVRCDRPIENDERMFFDVENGGICCAACARGDCLAFEHRNRVWMANIFRKGVEGFQDLPAADAPYAQMRRFAEARLEMPIKSAAMLP